MIRDEAKYGIPDDCPIQRTGNGGYHYIFKYDHARMSEMKPKIKCPKLNNKPIGVDMWIQDCQFVASPSVNYVNGKSYTWTKEIESIELLPALPEWLYTLYETEEIDTNGNIGDDIKYDIPALELTKPAQTNINNYFQSLLKDIKITNCDTQVKLTKEESEDSDSEDEFKDSDSEESDDNSEVSEDDLESIDSLLDKNKYLESFDCIIFQIN